MPVHGVHKDVLTSSMERNMLLTNLLHILKAGEMSTALQQQRGEL